MILIPLEKDEKTISSRFRKADLFVFIDVKRGIVVEKNHFKTAKSALFFENFTKYNVETLYVKELGYKTYLKLDALGIKISLILDDITYYTHLDPKEVIPLTKDNAKIYCTLGHHNKEVN